MRAGRARAGWAEQRGVALHVRRSMPRCPRSWAPRASGLTHPPTTPPPARLPAPSLPFPQSVARLCAAAGLEVEAFRAFQSTFLAHPAWRALERQGAAEAAQLAAQLDELEAEAARRQERERRERRQRDPAAAAERAAAA